LIGTNNALALGTASEQDCSDCDCGCDIETWFVPYEGEGTVGEILSTGVTPEGRPYVVVEAQFDSTEFGGYGATVVSPGNSVCCTYFGTEAVEGNAPSVIWLVCGEALPAYGAGWPHSGLLGGGTSLRGVAFFGGSPFTIKIIFEG